MDCGLWTVVYVCDYVTAKKQFKERAEYHDNRMSKREFREFVYSVVDEMGGGDIFDYFIEFLLGSVEVRQT